MILTEQDFLMIHQFQSKNPEVSCEKNNLIKARIIGEDPVGSFK